MHINYVHVYTDHRTVKVDCKVASVNRLFSSAIRTNVGGMKPYMKIIRTGAMWSGRAGEHYASEISNSKLLLRKVR